jgi:hypothetical protein
MELETIESFRTAHSGVPISNGSRAKIENIKRLWETGKYTVDQITKLTYQGRWEDEDDGATISPEGDLNGHGLALLKIARYCANIRSILGVADDE